MYKNIISYDGGWLRDSSDMDYLYETEEEAKEEAETDVENYEHDWELEGSEYEHELFDIEIVEV